MILPLFAAVFLGMILLAVAVDRLGQAILHNQELLRRARRPARTEDDDEFIAELDRRLDEGGRT